MTVTISPSVTLDLAAFIIAGIIFFLFLQHSCIELRDCWTNVWSRLAFNLLIEFIRSFSTSGPISNIGISIFSSSLLNLLIPTIYNCFSSISF